MDQMISVSFVTPVYSGEEYLKTLILSQEKLRNKWESIQDKPIRLIESIFVLDAPIDNSEIIIRDMMEDRPWMRIIVLSKNFGQHPAIISGILHTSGNWIVTMDEDMQHDPDYIHLFFKKMIHSSSDVVYAKSGEKVHNNIVRDLGSKGFKFIMSKIMQNRNIPNYNSYRLIRGPIGRAAASVCSHDTYFDIALGWFTERIVTVPIKLKDQRFIDTGRSGYSFSSLLSHARRMIVSSRARSFRIISVGSLMVILSSFIFGITVIFNKLLMPQVIPVPGWASIFVSILFFGGLVTLLLSIVIEYIVSMLLQIQGKPTYFIVDRSNDIILKNILSKL